ncbi:MAG: inositol monophosphatase [Proteobacteria bacterium]|nr:inositol monophosphatase [Pseudomonadota bacterium]MBU1717375.1 inositol monophosphatase [Pseudomonadota bacterium]
MKRIKNCLDNCDQNLAAILTAATEAALTAGKVIKGLYGKPHQIRHKGAIDLVTEADVAAEEAILEVLNKAFPHFAVLAEESHSDYREIPNGPTWIIDPLDGTTNFAHGFPWFGPSIACRLNGEIVVGVIYCPMQEELFYAVAGHGAWLNDKQIKVSATDSLIKSLVATGFPYDVETTLKQVMETLGVVLPKVQDVRRAGAAALDLAYVACGRLDGFWEMNLKPWDTAAGQLLVEEAGGQVTNFKGHAFSPFVPEILASNGKIHTALARLIS